MRANETANSIDRGAIAGAFAGDNGGIILASCELPRLSGLAVKVVHAHRGTNPELAVIRAKLAELAEELPDHLAGEEIAVFRIGFSLK